MFSAELEEGFPKGSLSAPLEPEVSIIHGAKMNVVPSWWHKNTNGIAAPLKHSGKLKLKHSGHIWCHLLSGNQYAVWESI